MGERRGHPSSGASMNFVTKLIAFAVWVTGTVGVAFAVVGQHLTPRQEAIVLGGLVAAIGLPTFVLGIHWWVNASVYGGGGRRPGEV